MTIEQAKDLLKENGYYVDNLWHIDDVKRYGNVSDEEAYEILDSTLHNDYTIETINTLIEQTYNYANS